MKLSTRGRYGLRAVVDIAVHGKGEAVAISSIAERQNISAKFLEQLIAKLKRAGIVTSMRGAQGGYRLAKSPDQISVGEILRVLEGDLNPVDCSEVTGDAGSCDGGVTCSGAGQCVTKIVWKRISDSINNAVDHLMLSELIEDGNSDKEGFLQADDSAEGEEVHG